MTLTHRTLFSIAAAARAGGPGVAVAAQQAGIELPPLLTAARDFVAVSRGTPKPQILTGLAQAEAGLTPETWRCEITADAFVEEPHTKVPAKVERQLTLANGTALDMPALQALGRKYEVHFVQVMQCLDIDTPLGQGRWTGVPLRHVLRLCGRINNVRRIYYWGVHNNDPKQIFKSPVSYTQCMETPPGDLPVFLAYRLHGEPISTSGSLKACPSRSLEPVS